ncbi:hypothetical protein NE237_027005 [Protea cynaroides]|uniref:Uncharacterized protein n=1 Tax=Protea cynaroides TaxID=273540 RepID=A0A9Q0GM42_9MAGN|nr:hypothetical protein NE237_027005 [Protea cynaroides]
MSGPCSLASFASDSLGLLPSSKRLPTMGRGTGPGGSFLLDPLIGLLRLVPKTRAEIHARRLHSTKNDRPNVNVKNSMLCFHYLPASGFELLLSEESLVCIYRIASGCGRQI